MARYGMLIDLKKCVGCNACAVACKSEHNLPNGICFTMVLEKERGVFPKSIRIFLPVLCNHCEHPTCVDVCPTTATYQREDGVVVIDNSKCIGCCACIEHCPYHVRQIVVDNRTLYPDNVTSFQKPVPQEIRNNTIVKCNMCFHRIDRSKQPACCEVCPTQARIFGDLSDQLSPISRLVKGDIIWRMLPEKNTFPCVYYKG